MCFLFLKLIFLLRNQYTKTKNVGGLKVIFVEDFFLSYQNTKMSLDYNRMTLRFTMHFQFTVRIKPDQLVSQLFRKLIGRLILKLVHCFSLLTENICCLILQLTAQIKVHNSKNNNFDGIKICLYAYYRYLLYK